MCGSVLTTDAAVAGARRWQSSHKGDPRRSVERDDVLSIHLEVWRCPNSLKQRGWTRFHREQVLWSPSPARTWRFSTSTVRYMRSATHVHTRAPPLGRAGSTAALSPVVRTACAMM